MFELEKTENKRKRGRKCPILKLLGMIYCFGGFLARGCCQCDQKKIAKYL